LHPLLLFWRSVEAIKNVSTEGRKERFDGLSASNTKISGTKILETKNSGQKTV
jgi:hypothetical protein